MDGRQPDDALDDGDSEYHLRLLFGLEFVSFRDMADSRQHYPQTFSGTQCILRLFLIVSAGFCLNVLVLALVDRLSPSDSTSVWYGRVTHPSDVAKRMLKFKVDTNAAWMIQSHENAKKQYYALQLNIDARIQSLSNAGQINKTNAEEIKTLLDTRQACAEVLSQKLPFHAAGFAEEGELYLQMLNFIALGVLIWLAVPTNPRLSTLELDETPVSFWEEMRTFFREIRDGVKASRWRARAPALMLGLGYFIILDGPSIILRLLLNEYSRHFEDGRRAFAFYAYDINRINWIFANISEFIMGWMLATIWLAWVDSHSKWKAHLSRWDEDAKEEALLRRTAELSELFHDWQRNSLLLGAAFLPWTYFDWNFSHLETGSDTKYIYYALVDHLTWIATWVLISLPFLDALKAWRNTKLRFVFQTDLSERIQKGNLNPDQFKYILEMEPVSDLQLIGASIAAAVSFLLPIFNILK